MIKVIILCGGIGSRLKSLNSDLPKPLIPLNGKPILQHIIEFYISNGIRDFILCTGFKADAIHSFVSSKKFDAEIEFSNAGGEASMLKRIYLVRDKINKKAIITYGDTFINIDPYRILDHHEEVKKSMTITVADIQSPFGIVRFDDKNRVTSFKEKPFLTYYIGLMIFEKCVFDDFEMELLSKPDGEGLICLFQNLIKEKDLNAFKHSGLQLTFNTKHEHQQAEEKFINFFTEQRE